MRPKRAAGSAKARGAPRITCASSLASGSWRRRGGRGRERPWRATSLYTAWPNVSTTPELADASRLLERFVLERYVERLQHWFARRATESLEWQEAAAYGDSLLYLTADELAELRDALAELAEQYLERTLGRGFDPREHAPSPFSRSRSRTMSRDARAGRPVAGRTGRSRDCCARAVSSAATGVPTISLSATRSRSSRSRWSRC